MLDNALGEHIDDLHEHISQIQAAGMRHLSNLCFLHSAAAYSIALMLLK